MEKRAAPMGLFLADIPYVESDGRKTRRPVLIVKVQDKTVFVFKVTKRCQDKSPQIKSIYYPVKMWREAGLKVPSYIDTHDLFQLPLRQILNQRPIGKLTTTDAQALYQFIQAHYAEIQHMRNQDIKKFGKHQTD